MESRLILLDSGSIPLESSRFLWNLAEWMHSCRNLWGIKKYSDGVADACSYHCFVTEATEYVTTGKVCQNKQVFVLSYYLESKAYDFFTQKVPMNYQHWTLWEFFEQMFNYYFPVNYRRAQRQKLFKMRKQFLSIYMNLRNFLR